MITSDIVLKGLTNQELRTAKEELDVHAKTGVLPEGIVREIRMKLITLDGSNVPPDWDMGCIFTTIAILQEIATRWYEEGL